MPGGKYVSLCQRDIAASGSQPCERGHERRPARPALAVMTFRSHGGALLEYAAQRVARTGVTHLVEPEELVAEAIETLLKPSRCPGDAPGALRYLKGVIRHRALRRRRVDRFLPIDSLHPDPRQSDAYTRAHLAFVKRDVAAALESLPRRQRLRCIQHFLDRDKLREIAADHHVSICTVKTECARARRRLKQRLAQYDGKATHFTPPGGTPAEPFPGRSTPAGCHPFSGDRGITR